MNDLRIILNLNLVRSGTFRQAGFSTCRQIDRQILELLSRSLKLLLLKFGTGYEADAIKALGGCVAMLQKR